VLDGSGRLVRIIDLDEVQSLVPVEALIMAGGRGERLRPYTDEVPKPLIEVGGRPIIEHSLDLLRRHGIRHVSISVNYLKERIIEHIGDGSRFGLSVRYVHEDAPMGTAGALARLGPPAHDTLLLMNSDLLTDAGLDRMYRTLRDTGAELVMATKEHQVSIPYAVMELEADSVVGFREKPTMAYPCNAGIYMMKRSVAALVPADRPYNATDLIQDLLDRGARMAAFPLAGYWLDIGKHEDLQRARRDHG
jgi:NDP-sugar pyrophosphorylase family protein